MNFLVDTNILSELFKARPNPSVTTWLSAQDLIGISVITLEEIHYGLAYKNATKQLIWLNNFLKFNCNLFPITPEIAEKCG